MFYLKKPASCFSTFYTHLKKLSNYRIEIKLCAEFLFPCQHNWTWESRQVLLRITVGKDHQLLWLLACISLTANNTINDNGSETTIPQWQGHLITRQSIDNDNSIWHEMYKYQWWQWSVLDSPRSRNSEKRGRISVEVELKSGFSPL